MILGATVGPGSKSLATMVKPIFYASLIPSAQSGESIILWRSLPVPLFDVSCDQLRSHSSTPSHSRLHLLGTPHGIHTLISLGFLEPRFWKFEQKGRVHGTVASCPENPKCHLESSVMGGWCHKLDDSGSGHYVHGWRRLQWWRSLLSILIGGRTKELVEVEGWDGLKIEPSLHFPPLFSC
ncbi:uncharacterized protein EI90DRAFT_1334224 [Cantharellus anzutake]|uniref:uncharacterized protein n=1 Tax=Cantharellus anzutake TaxID=1750568 RepID=UPI001908ECAE|nr:uncharacterized protein EI90DRAFT_1334224 [Cantharellus anzutake]KAF8329681.1 hypothetical protein EI90DRAFT_1334224 [Cantharellus anzutake]